VYIMVHEHKIIGGPKKEAFLFRAAQGMSISFAIKDGKFHDRLSELEFVNGNNFNFMTIHGICGNYNCVSGSGSLFMMRAKGA
jgi:hypothetical protein